MEIVKKFFIQSEPEIGVKDLERLLSESVSLLDDAKEYLEENEQALRDLDKEINRQEQRLERLKEKTNTKSVSERIDLEKEYRYNKNDYRSYILENIERAKRAIEISERKIAKYRKDLGLDK
ncbi:MAG: hypothetical protein IT416_02635 [Candidatus Pacebacteria bacterium]|nr:hypothetical protein [Candidatus Paceibacterota bacterium]